MNIDVNRLPDNPALLKKLLAEHAEKLAQATARNRYLEEQFRLAQQKQFGKSAEGFDAQGEFVRYTQALRILKSGKND